MYVISCNQNLFDSSTLTEKDWTVEEVGKSPEKKPAPQFLGGIQFLARILKGRLYLWGGAQKQSDGRFLPLPNDLVYSLDLSCRSLTGDRVTGGRWEILKATGKVHPGYNFPASAVCGETIYILGGAGQGGKYTNAVSSLSPSANFE